MISFLNTMYHGRELIVRRRKMWNLVGKGSRAKRLAEVPEGRKTELGRSFPAGCLENTGKTLLRSRRDWVGSYLISLKRYQVPGECNAVSIEGAPGARGCLLKGEKGQEGAP